MRTFIIVILATVLSMTSFVQADEPTKVTINENQIPTINGKATFPISVAVLPPADGKTPTGKSAWQEFADAGVNLARVVPHANGETYGWTDEGYKSAHQYLDALAA